MSDKKFIFIDCQKQVGSYTPKDKGILDGVSELLEQQRQKKFKEEMKRKCLGRCHCDCLSCDDCIAK